ncbi:hypothetical protein [Sphingorhabdus sp. YGSMI21]|uniref:hypothetical protein n=1 Tax=Sphingorhabdus sp. YGSMI21 TaxID=2077182 RepID=UPI000C1F8746|nr:hypothetical protein [Sphingorhabdus sp. YGSMI21]ATW02182.1 hypothetical protein CHN51_00535 [Sphingorhabdus sp. YGSMI21]
MNWRKLIDIIFPYIETLPDDQVEKDKERLAEDLASINSAKFRQNEEHALDEARRVAASEDQRVKTAESKATTYLAVLAALVPLLITLQSTYWESKAGPAPSGLKFVVLITAMVYVMAAGYHSFKALQVSGFQRVGEADVASAWGSSRPLARLTRNILLASRRSRDVVNSKVTRIRVIHHHLLRAFVAFILLLLLDPLFYSLGYRVQKTTDDERGQTVVIESNAYLNEKPGAYLYPGKDEIKQSGRKSEESVKSILVKPADKTKNK